MDTPRSSTVVGGDEGTSGFRAVLLLAFADAAAFLFFESFFRTAFMDRIGASALL